MALVLGVGVGVFVLGFLWVVALTTCVFTVRSVGSVRYLGTGAILVSALLSVILIFIPRDPRVPTAVDESLQYGYMDLYRTLLLIFCSISAIIGVIFYFATQIMEPIYTMPVTKISL